MGSGTKYVYDFAEGNRDLKDLLGGKGANLAEMTNLGLPVPPGFVITTEACREYLNLGSAPAALEAEVTEHLAGLEKAMGKGLGDAADPLLVSVRSGAKFSMPGMMDTVLNIGLNDQSVEGLAKQGDNPRFAWDSYRRLVQMFGKTVLGVDGELFEHAMDEAKKAKGTTDDLDLDENDFRDLVATFKGIVKDATGRDFPQDPREQMDLAVSAVFDSWNGDRARLYRRQERIPADLGTAVNICTMVFGNMGMSSGTGVAFTRDPGSGEQGSYGDYLQNAQGEDVVAGIRNTVPLADLEAARQGLLRPAHADHVDAGAALPRPVRHRVHRRARQALDAADPGRQAHGGRRLPYRHPARRRGPHRPRRGAAAGHRCPARHADVPALRRRRPPSSASARASTPHPAPRSAVPSSTPTPPSSGRPAASRSSWSAARPPRTTCTA